MSHGHSQAFSQSMSQSQSQARQGSENFDPVEKEKKVDELVQYMLVMDQKKIPIKKKDINRIVLKGHNRSFAPVMEEASKKFLEVYGFKVVELLDRMKDCYILVNNVEYTQNQQKIIEVSEKENAELGLVSVILGMIFMNGNVIHEDEMWHALKKLGIFQDEIHGTFGNVKSLIMKDFVRKGYLHTELNNSTDPPTKDMLWGQRAEHEMSKRNILSIVCDIHETKPDDWIRQMQQVEQQEQTRAEANDTPGPSSSAH